MVRNALMAALTLAAACIAVALPSAPASALPTCYRTAGLDTGSVGPVPVPSAGTTAASTSCIMGNGATSAAVRRLQETLNACYRESLAKDGIFGNQTQAALRRAQSREGTTADGVYGPYTRDRLLWWTGSYWSDGTPICYQVNGPGGY